MMIDLKLPYPPSANRYWRSYKGRVIVSAPAMEYRRVVASMVSKDAVFNATDRVTALLATYPPDRRKRDLDNVLKVIFDALEKAGVYPDDNQIETIFAIRQQVSKPGYVMLRLLSN